MSAENTPPPEETPDDETEFAQYSAEEELSLREIDAMQDDVLARLDQLNNDILKLIDTIQTELNPPQPEQQHEGQAKAA